MTICHLLKFSIRRNMITRPERMAKVLTEALGCQFRKDYYQKETPSWKSNLLGMEIHLYEWRGVKDSRIYRLHGEPDNWTYAKYSKVNHLEFSVIDISSAVVDLLGAKDDDAWYVPSEEDIQAEIAYGGRIHGSR